MSNGGYVVIYPLSAEDMRLVEATDYVRTFRDVSGGSDTGGRAAVVLDEMNSFDADALIAEAPAASWEVWCSVGVYESSEMWFARIAGFEAGKVVRAPMVNRELVIPVPILLSHAGHMEKYVASCPPVMWRRRIDSIVGGVSPDSSPG